VRGRPVEQTFDRVLGYTDEAKALGFIPGTTLLELRTHSADEIVAGALQIARGADVLVVTRLRTADEAPLAIQIAHLAPAFLELSQDKLRRNESLYRTLDLQFGIAPHHAHQTVSARQPTSWERRELAMPADVPVLSMERTTYDERGVPFEYVRSVYRGDRYRLAQDLRPPEQRPAADHSEGEP
jgi:GntR family transcriptional regulator